MCSIAKKVIKNIYLKPRSKYFYKKYLKTFKNNAKAELSYNPKISIIVPLYNTPQTFFEEMVQSVFSQIYDNWELILINDNSSLETVESTAQKYVTKDHRIVYKKLTTSHHIAGATNEGIKRATGEFVSLLDHDDILRPEALYEIAKALNVNPELDFIYTDEDQIDNDTEDRSQPYLKPDWNPDLLYTVNYITHFVTVRKTVLDKYGYEDKEYNGTQDWELFLRITRNIPHENIHHIATPLYSWRVHDDSTAKSFDTKPYLLAAQKKAVQNNLQQLGYKDFTVFQHEQYPGMWNISWTLKDHPSVAIVINRSLPKSTEGHIKNKTNYQQYTTYRGITPENSREVYSKDFIVFIDQELYIKSTTWLSDLMGDAQRKEVGCVSARYAVVGDVMFNVEQLVNRQTRDFIANISRRTVSKNLYITSRYNVPIVKSGAVAVETAKLKKVFGGGVAQVSIEIISQKLHEAGYRNLYNPYIKVLK